MSITFAMTPIKGSRYRVIDTSVLQLFFLSVPKCYHECRKTLWVSKITKKNEYKDTYDMLCVMRLTQNQKTQ